MGDWCHVQIRQNLPVPVPFRPVGIIASVIQVYLLVILLSRDFESISFK